MRRRIYLPGLDDPEETIQGDIISSGVSHLPGKRRKMCDAEDMRREFDQIVQKGLTRESVRLSIKTTKAEDDHARVRLETEAGQGRADGAR